MPNEPRLIELPVKKFSVPVMIALLARIQDQLNADEETSDLAEVLALVNAMLFERRDQARDAMLEVDEKRRRNFPWQVTATPAAMC